MPGLMARATRSSSAHRRPLLAGWTACSPAAGIGLVTLYSASASKLSRAEQPAASTWAWRCRDVDIRQHSAAHLSCAGLPVYALGLAMLLVAVALFGEIATARALARPRRHAHPALRADEDRACR
jgi:hypothetical protein